MATLSRGEFADCVLGESSEPWSIDTSEANRRAAVRMLEQARTSVDLFSRDLDAAVYDNRAVVEALRRLVVSSRRARVRILARDSTRAVSHGHRLVDLARRLSTFVEIRLTAREHRNFNTALLVVDTRGTIVRKFADRYEGVVCFDSPKEGRDLTKSFDEMWAVSRLDPNLRALHV